MSNLAVVVIALVVVLALVFVVAPIVVVLIATSSARSARKTAERALRIRK
ncbi:MAG: hypothetical protein IJZ54_00115 [Clostridia bacterium]|nr:hypothetical protein [Clostridia bacterium]